MNPRMFFSAWSVAISLTLAAGAVIAAPWEIINFKHVEADPSKSYELTEKNGPWVIMVTTFTENLGEERQPGSKQSQAEEDAHNLVLDLRKNFQLNAYYFAKTYDFSQREKGLGLTPEGKPKVMRHQGESSKLREIAVVVGDFPRVDDSDAHAALKKIKQAQPESLKTSKSASLAEYRRQFNEHVQQIKSPLTRAFVAPNPLIPSEYFAPKGPDKFIVDLNKKVEYSLLDCPGKYSLCIATYKGNAIIDQQKIRDVQANRRDMATQLDVAADRAHRMVVELRKLGYEAYEFHDRESSIVTYGHFDAVGTSRGDGTIEPLPEIQRAIEFFGAHDQAVPDPGTSVTGMIPRKMAMKGPNSDLVFDVQPTPVIVPKRSIAAEYANRGN